VQNLTGTIFFQRIIAPRFFNRPTDEAIVAKALKTDIPKCLDYLAGELDGKEYFAGGQFSIADIGIATHFVNAKFVNYAVDAKRWPKLASWVERVHARPSFAKTIKEEAAAFGIEL